MRPRPALQSTTASPPPRRWRRQSRGGFDIVTCMEMLEHVPEPCRDGATLGQLVRPGGAVFVSTLNRNLKSFLLAIVGGEYLTAASSRAARTSTSGSSARRNWRAGRAPRG